MSLHAPFVFVVGAPRSGTTLVQQMLATRVAIPPETHFIRRFWQRRRSIGDLEKSVNWDQLVSQIVSTPEFVEAGLTAQHLHGMAHSYQGALRGWLEGYARLKDCPVAGEKTPNHLLAMDLLADWYPDARFVHIVRDPRAVVLSSRQTPWTTGSYGGDAEIWRRYLSAARRSATAGTGRYLATSYEDLVENPERALRAICLFAGVEFSPDMLDLSTTRPSFNPDREPWKAGATSPVHSGSADRWQQQLSSRQLAVVEGVAGVEMVRWGYTPVVAQGKRLAAAFATAPMRSLQFTRHLHRQWLTYR